MPTVTASVDIAAEPGRVTTVLLDAAAAPLWTEGLEYLEVVEGDVGEPGCLAGAHYAEGSRRYVLHDRLTLATPGRHYESIVEGGGLRAAVDTTIETRDVGTTTVTVRWSGTGTNPLTWLVVRVMRRRIAARARRDLVRLKALVESTSTFDDR